MKNNTVYDENGKAVYGRCAHCAKMKGRKEIEEVRGGKWICFVCRDKAVKG